MKTRHNIFINNSVWISAKSSGLNISKFLETKLIEHLQLVKTNKNTSEEWKAKLESTYQNRGHVTVEYLLYLSNKYSIKKEIIEEYCNEMNIPIKNY